MESVWQKDIRKVCFGSLEKKKNTDVLIIGGGIAGVLCAYKLKNAGVDCVLAEAKEILGGVTENTTAKITSAHGFIYNSLIKRFGEEKAGLYLEAQMKACDEYARLCRDIDCDYETKDSYVYSTHGIRNVEREADALNRLGIDAQVTENTVIPVNIKGAVLVKAQAQFHPLKFLYTLAEGLPIFEHTKVLQLKPNTAVTDKGVITFKKLIVATHFPMLNKHGFYFLKLYQHRSYVIALRGAQNVGGMYVDESDKGLSLRNYGELLLLGGGAHRTGKKGGGWKELEEFKSKHYKNAKIVEKWATQDCMTLDGVPYIGRYSANLPDVFVATGFNKWGMTNAMASADILCDLILGKTNPYESVFSPSRSIFHPQLAVNVFDSAVGLLTPTVPRCPHLGCALKYNSEEHTWDCPCHGSRFRENGELINNPATDDHKTIGK